MINFYLTGKIKAAFRWQVDLEKNQIRAEALHHFQSLSAVRCLLDINERKPVNQNFFQRSAEGIVWIDDQYFRTFDIPLVAGRDFDVELRNVQAQLASAKATLELNREEYARALR